MSAHPAVPSIDQKTCTGCGRCAEVCSTHTLAMEAGEMTAATRMFMGKTTHRAMRDFVRPLYDHLLKRWDEGQDVFTYDAPLAMLFHADAMADAADCHIAATCVMIAAQSLGLGTCMLGTTAALAHAKPFKRKYGIPVGNKIGLGLVLGYPLDTFQRGIRRSFASVAFA